MPRIFFFEPTISYTSLRQRVVYKCEAQCNSENYLENHHITSEDNLLFEVCILDVLLSPLRSKVAGKMSREPHGLVSAPSKRSCEYKVAYAHMARNL